MLVYFYCSPSYVITDTYIYIYVYIQDICIYVMDLTLHGRLEGRILSKRPKHSSLRAITGLIS